MTSTPGGVPDDLHVMHVSPFYVLGVAPARDVALLRRTDKAFPGLTVLGAENELVIASFRGCSTASVIVDMRAAPPNNDERFETAMRGLRVAVGKAFQRVIVVVASASGEMQVTRLHRTERADYLVTRDLAQAWQLARSKHD